MVLVLYGAGSTGIEVYELARQCGEWHDIVFIDDNRGTDSLLGCSVYDFRQFRETYPAGKVTFIITLDEPKFRKAAYEKMIRAGYQAGILVHPSAYISKEAEIEGGAVLGAGVSVGAFAKIGKNFYASRNVTVGSDTQIGDHVVTGAGAFVGRYSRIGDEAVIGTGALINDHIGIGTESIVAIGAVVFKDVPDRLMVIGNPARIIDYNKNDNVDIPEKQKVIVNKTDVETDTDHRYKEMYAADEVSEKYWEVFSSCFNGMDFNPVTFRFRDSGWDSITQINLISGIEEAFNITLKAREILKINSYTAGLRLIRSKLTEKYKDRG